MKMKEFGVPGAPPLDPPMLIPLVDLAGVHSGSKSALNQAATEIHKAFSTIGFVYLINHGIPETQVWTQVNQGKRKWNL